MKTGGAHSRLRHALAGFALCGVAFLSGCASAPRARAPAIDPDAARAEITRLLPQKLANRTGWAVDIFAAFETLSVPPTADNICAVIAIAEQESNLQVNPPVPGLPAIARREIEARAASHHVPMLVVQTALDLRSPDGRSYRDRLDSARSEKALSDLYQDFIAMVPLGGSLFGSWNPVRTGGPMQVSIAFAEQHASRKRYPYPLTGSIRDEVFTRRGGMYFGIAHLLDYPATYDDMLFRFADYNAGHYASRNAAFQNAASIASGTPLAPDGDLLRHGSGSDEPSNTELALRKIGARLELSNAEIRRSLEQGEQEGFERTQLYSRVFARADTVRGRKLPRAVVPRIELHGPKITRRLTTDWFAHRVGEHYGRCLGRDSRVRPT